MLIFPNQHLSIEQQIYLSFQFGDLEVFPEEDKTNTRPKVHHVATIGRHLAPDDNMPIFQKVSAC